MLTGRPHDTSVQKVTMKMWMHFNVMPRTKLVDLKDYPAITHRPTKDYTSHDSLKAW